MYSVILKDNETGEQATRVMDVEWHDSSVFWWTEGNFACDCNRHSVFFATDGDDEAECGDHRFTAICAILETGERIPLDDV